MPIGIILHYNKSKREAENTAKKINKFSKCVLIQGDLSKTNDVKLIFEKLFPNREIMMLETENINYGGGNIHCITMNVPKI